MADIRINALAGTATSSASDDYLAIDGAANGTRKLSAYSPTFGGNLTVSGGAMVKGTTYYSQETLQIGDASTVQNYALGLRSNGASALEMYYAGAGLSTWHTGVNTSSQFYIGLDGAAQKFTLTTAGNATLAGNLTVSGTGTSSVAGVLQVGPLAPLNQLDVSKSGTNNRVSVQVGTGDNGIHFIDNGGTRYTIGSSIGLYAPGDYFAFNRYSGSSWSEMGRFAPSGNLLLGTTTDSSNGKLQLATHTTSAGGIGFGTETSFFRSAAGNLQLSASVTSAAIAINNVGSGVAALAYDATGALVYSTGSLRFQTNSGTLALTLDSSQAATFSQGVKISGLGPVFSASSSAVYNQIVGGVTPQIQWINSSGGTDSKVVDWLVTSNQLQGRFVNDTNGAANNWLTVTRSNYSVTSVAFGGPIKLANAYVASVIVPTGYVTIQDSTGTTYKVAVSL